MFSDILVWIQKVLLWSIMNKLNWIIIKNECNICYGSFEWFVIITRWMFLDNNVVDNKKIDVYIDYVIIKEVVQV